MAGNGFDMDHPGGGHAYDPMHRSVRDDVLTEAWPANVKRTYDETGRTYLEYQDMSQDRARARMDAKTGFSSWPNRTLLIPCGTGTTSKP